MYDNYWYYTLVQLCVKRLNRISTKVNLAIIIINNKLVVLLSIDRMECC